tara:strand:- start:3263 stop:3652 length:390 start_codon:yes stop_codon:yes gene_type:complete
MDDSLTNLMNESQIETNIYKFDLNITNEDRIMINKILFILSFIINLYILFNSDIIINIILFIVGILSVVCGTVLIYTNEDHIRNNIGLFSIYILSVMFELVLIINNNTANFIPLLFSILYQIIYIVNLK